MAVLVHQVEHQSALIVTPDVILPNRFIEKARTQSKSAVFSKLKEGAIKYAKKEIKDIFK